MFCTNCGANNNEGAKFCTKCGLQLSYNAAADNAVDKKKKKSRNRFTISILSCYDCDNCNHICF